jgi:hypothetical protein
MDQTFPSQQYEICEHGQFPHKLRYYVFEAATLYMNVNQELDEWLK